MNLYFVLMKGVVYHMENRGEWGTRVGFILAAIGSAIGLGNIWRFPYTVASNGGGAYLIPYFVALLTAGIPLMILEFGLGHKLRTSAPGVFAKLNKKWQWIGWWQCGIAFVIVVYYVAIIGWSMSYLTYAFGLKWGADTGSFFYSYLGLSDGPFQLGGLQPKVLIPLILVWVINYIVLAGGIKGGIEKANKIFMPLLIISILVITVRGLTLPGAVDGLNYLFTPDFSKILNGRVWVAAYGQIFYTLSICFAIMLAYSSYLPKKSDIVNNAFITSFGNCGFSLIAGIAVFSILGYMALTQGASIEEVAGSGGVGLAFVVFPMAINALPGANGIFGVLFFLCLVFAGLSSSMSIIEAFVSGITDKFNVSRKKALTVSCIVGLIVSLIYATGAGLYILDIVDHFNNSYGIALAGLVEAILLGWFFNLEVVRNHVNPISDFKIGKWWNVCVKYVTVILLGIMILLNIYQDIVNPYEGYPVNALIILCAIVVCFSIIAGFIVSRMKGSENFRQSISKEVK